MTSFHRLFFVIAILTQGAWPARADSPQLTALLNSAEWKSFVIALAPCRKDQPKAFFPLELMRLDEVSADALTKMVRQHATQWVRKSEEFGSGPERQRSQLKLSCDANRALQEFFVNAQKSADHSLKGSTISLLRSLPENQRNALSLLDGVFFTSSDVGKKVLSDLKKHPELNLQAFSYDEGKGVVSFEGSPGAWGNLNISPRPYYELKFKNYQSDSTWKFRGIFTGDPTPVSADIVQNKENYRGSVFNPGSNSPNLPFGAFPSGKQMFKDETGLSHYQGDGHNHKH
ncbi:MAG: hypothetical protein ABIR96_11615 [Bdellovibrionota bacterium]